MGLTEFVEECKKVESRLELRKECEVMCACIGDKSIAVEGYNFPYQAHIITSLMKDCGSFL